jgi:hypothetical protein
VIQAVLYCFAAPANQFVIDGIGGDVLDISTNRHGCCVVQRCIDVAIGDTRNRLINQILASCVAMVQDAFGNYVVQYVLDQVDLTWNAKFAALFTRKMLPLSQQKFSSNVIEKCLELNDGPTQRAMISEIGRAGNIPVMLCDRYGNYVVQKALSLAEGDQHTSLLTLVRANLDLLRTSEVGKRIFAKLSKMYPALSDGRVRSESAQ